MAFDYSTLITDRTADDVAYVKELVAKGWSGMSTDERAEFLAGLKGAYNYTDLNRVIAAMKDIVERVSDAGGEITYLEVNSGEDFTVCQIPDSDLEDYLTDVKTIQEYFGLTDYELPDNMLSLDYTYANNIETILWLGAFITEIGTAAVLTDEDDIILTDEDDVILVDTAGDEGEVDWAVGDQITYEWTADTTSTLFSGTYENVNNVVSLEDKELEDGSTVSALTLQWEKTHPWSIQFDAPEALYYASSKLPAGNYYFTCNIINSSYEIDTAYAYELTLTQPLPASGQICLTNTLSSTNPLTTASFTTYESTGSANAIEVGTISSCLLTDFDSTGKTKLGVFGNYVNGNFNSYQRTMYGYSRYSQSAFRQWLNSAEGRGFWWKPQNNWDRPPDALYRTAGFLSGYGTGIRNQMLSTRIETVVPETGGTEIDVTYDKVFIASREQQNITPTYEGLEGDTWQYWIDETGSEDFVTPSSSSVYPQTYSVSGRTVITFLRTAPSSITVTGISASGTTMSAYGANSSAYCRPTFCIKKS